MTYVSMIILIGGVSSRHSSETFPCAERYEEMAISEEAQRARDYLIPIESSVQPPRPLDAQRLRQRLSMD